MPPGSNASAVKRYARPPIVEAVINVHVIYSDGLSEATIQAIEDHFSPQFTHCLRMEGLDVNLGAHPTDEVATTRSVVGLRFANEENNRILQIRSEGFAYSHLTPYSTWEELRSEAEPLWFNFISICKPARVSRLAVKFINRLSIPSSSEMGVQLEDFLTFRPHVPPEFEQLTGFMTQVQLPFPELAGNTPQALVTVASQPPTVPRTEAVVLDIDVFEGLDWATDDSRIWSELERMRAVKNRIFEAALTDKIKDTFL